MIQEAIKAYYNKMMLIGISDKTRFIDRNITDLFKEDDEREKIRIAKNVECAIQDLLSEIKEKKTSARHSRKITDIEDQVLSQIRKHNHDNPITGRQIAMATGIYDKEEKMFGAQVRHAINRLRDKGTPICANGKGYYMPKDKLELVDYIQLFQKRIIEQQKALENLKIAVNSWDFEV